MATLEQLDAAKTWLDVLPKIDILRRVVHKGLVAVVRAETAEKATRISEACAQGGIEAVEVTFTVPQAHRVIEGLAARFATDHAMVLGAGTVLDSETARIAILSGAKYIISPSFDAATARLCNRYQVPYMPGAATPAEVVQALEAGADIIKIFPGETLGPAFVKALRAPLPQAPMMPSGGVSLENVGEWIRAGCVAVSAGGMLTKGAAKGDYDSISRTAERMTELIAEARKA